MSASADPPGGRVDRPAPLTKADVEAAINSYIDAGGSVGEDGLPDTPEGTEVAADQLSQA